MAAMKKKPTPKIIARAHDMRSGSSRCCTCCMNCNPFQHAAHISQNDMTSDFEEK
jgi:hypothetical protein